MYDIIADIISHTWVASGTDQEYIYAICAALILVLTAVFIDMVVRILFRFCGTR